MPRRALAAILVILLCGLAALATHLATAKGDTVFSGKRPQNLGVRDGRFASCGRRLNCVSSQADPADLQRYVAPIALRGDAAQAIATARRAVQGMARAAVVRQEGSYLHAEFRSKWMGFVDDVEFFYDGSAGLLHVRSASRLGRRDFGVNRARVAALRARIEGRPGA